MTALNTIEAQADDSGLTAAEECLARVEWQAVVFAARPRRLDILGLKPAWSLRPVHVRVMRNQSFELIASAATRMAAYAGLDLICSLGEYDDSLTDVDVSEADVAIVWLDFDRFDGPDGEVAAWLAGRIEAMRRFGDAPVLIHTPPQGNRDSGDDLRSSLEAALAGVPDAHVVDQTIISADLGGEYLDARAAAISGSRLSGAASLMTARDLALRWIPAATGALVKAIAIDLDGTMYSGALGEDGPAGVGIEPAHRALAKSLLRLRDRGVFLTLLSRNDPQDVAALFDLRPDMLLRPHHLSASSVSWAPKSKGVEHIARALRIGVENLLVVDDNPGELTQIASSLLGVSCLWADPTDASSTERALNLYPGLHRLTTSAEDRLRVTDLAAATQRSDGLRTSADPNAYLASLNIELFLSMNDFERVQRLSDLSHKTNQFNTTLKRMGETELLRYMSGSDTRVISADLQDRLSNSGTICVVAARRQGTELIVEELAMSCRALGRGIESQLVLAMLSGAVEDLPVSTVIFPLTSGPRNAPARTWLKRFTGTDPTEGEVARLRWNGEEVAASLSAAPVSISWRKRS